MPLAILGQRNEEKPEKCEKKKSQDNAHIVLDSQNNATLVLENALSYFK